MSYVYGMSDTPANVRPKSVYISHEYHARLVKLCERTKRDLGSEVEYRIDEAIENEGIGTCDSEPLDKAVSR